MAKKEIGRPQTAHIAPFGLRLQADLKSRVEAVSKANGRSMNAEISAILQDSLDGSKDAEIERLREQVKRLEGETAPYRLSFSKERAELLNLRLFALRMAKAIPLETLDRDPDLVKEVIEFARKEREIYMDILEASILSFYELPDVINRRIESGQLKVIPHNPEAPSTVWSDFPNAAKRGREALFKSMSQVDEKFLIELFDRPAVRAAMHPQEEKESLIELEKGADESDGKNITPSD